MRAHVVARGVIDAIVAVGTAQQLEEVDTAFRGGGFEVGEALVADVGAVAVLPAMARTCVVDMDVSAGGQAREQQLFFFLVKALVLLGEDAVELAGGDVDAPLA